MGMMWYQWQAALSVALLIFSFTAAKPTTQGTLVVSRSEEETSTVASEVTTMEANPPVKLTEMEVNSKISLRYAHTSVVTHVRNPAKRAQETTFRMLLPDTAFISGFTMTIDGKDYKAYVKEKEEAKQIYNDAVSQGFGAAHIAAKARDSNHFTVTINVEPNKTITFNLTYEELLVRRNSVYNHCVNLHPGNLVAKLKVTVHIKESAKITVLRVPELRTGNEVDAMENDPQNDIAVSTQKLNGDREAIITFTPNLDDQRRLMQVYAEKSKESFGDHKYYIEDDAEPKNHEGVLGQFVVQYDVDRSKSGEILVNDGYFVHFFAPSSLPPLPKHVVFVLDTSGSMMGRKVEQLRDAMQTILGKMHKNDYFSIVEFNSYVEVLDLHKAQDTETSTRRYYYYDRPSEPTKLLPPSRATPENIAKAKTIVSKLEASGGTNIASALDVAVDLIQRGVGLESSPAKAENQTELESHDASTKKTTNDSNDTTKLKNKLEPIIIFLTDGDPTVGETDPTRITNRLTEKNYGELRASIFALAFGGDADRKFLRKLSLRNEGFMRHIYEASDAALQLQDFYRTVSSPLVSDVKFVYPRNQIKEGSLTKHKFRTYYAGSEVVVAGKIQDEVTEIQPQVLGFCGVQDSDGRTRYEISPKVPVEQHKSDFYPLERLWAYLTIKQLLDQKDALIESNDDNDKESKKSLEKKALDIALKYEMVTPLTSLVVVKPNDTKAVDAESVDDQNENLELAPSRLAGGAYPMYAALRTLALPALAIDTSSYALMRPSGAHFHSRPSAVYSKYASGLPGSAPAIASFSISADRFDFNEPEEEEEETAVDRIFGGAPVVTTPVERRKLQTTEQSSTTIDPLESYGLKEFSWAASLLDVACESLNFSINGTQVTLKLSSDYATLLTAPGAPCVNALDGGLGRCEYLARCAAARTITVSLYEISSCIYDSGYAGVCCPEQKENSSQSP